MNDKPCQTCKNKFDCLECVRLGIDVKCRSDKHENYEQEEQELKNKQK